MTYQVSPVAEDTAVTPEVINGWFNKLSTMVVAASNQAAELRRVQEDFAVANQRLDVLLQDNNKLKTEVAETWRLVSEMERERDEAKATVERVREDMQRQSDTHDGVVRDLRDQLAAAHDAMAGRDQRIAELEALLTTANGENRYLQDKAGEAERKLAGATGDANYWHGRYSDVVKVKQALESEAAGYLEDRETLQGKLASVQAKLAEVSSIFAPKQEPNPAGDYGFGEEDRQPQVVELTRNPNPEIKF